MRKRRLTRWVLVFVIVTLMGACSDSSSPEDSEIKAVEQFWEAIPAGDIDAAMEMLDPRQVSTADRQFWEFFYTLTTYGIKVDLTDCVVELDAVACRGEHEDAVAEALELPDGTYRFSYANEKVTWIAPDPVTLASGETRSPQQFLKVVYYDYLTGYYPDEYDAVCSPVGYDASSVIVINGLAFTAECAELIGPLDQEMADWVRAGRPAP